MEPDDIITEEELLEVAMPSAGGAAPALGRSVAPAEADGKGGEGGEHVGEGGREVCLVTEGERRELMALLHPKHVWKCSVHC